jgi:hypothetical protein
MVSKLDSTCRSVNRMELIRFIQVEVLEFNTFDMNLSLSTHL